ncbi:LAGLIDADG family homing endonuclease [Candidatus Peregrinibacteria bacterium]|nr:LAGLIDADG family homing endonuclease [Candidatus Peregrinibacteria bacterium]
MNAPFYNLFKSPFEAYILGLWCADGYHRTSSIGISTTNERILSTFYAFLKNLFAINRLKLKLYYPEVSSTEGEYKWRKRVGKIFRNISRKATSLAYHLYVDCRPLLRSFQDSRTRVNTITKPALIAAYFAGRFDGDGSIALNKKNDCRIVYSNFNEVMIDKKLLERLGIVYTSIYHYKKAKTFCLYIHTGETRNFISRIKKFSIRL